MSDEEYWERLRHGDNKERPMHRRKTAGVLLLSGLSLTALLLAQPDLSDFQHWKNRPAEAFSSGESSFRKVFSQLLKEHYNDQLTEDQLYAFALEGMLSGLNEEKREWNKLYSPAEYAELRADLEGKIVGAGVEIKFNPEAGAVDVLSVIPSSPAEKADIRRGDRIIKVQGKSVQGAAFRDVVYAIRGKVGERIDFTILRGDKIVSKSFKRAPVPWVTVEHRITSDQVGVLQINQFSEDTSTLLRSALAKFKEANVRAIVFDLRGNTGGLFEKAVEAMEMFIPAGKPLVTVLKRGKKQELLKAKGTPEITAIPLIALVDGETSCGAEMLAVALKENLGAMLVGKKTFGKWSAQKIDELPNRYAVKYTVSGFLSPSGKAYDGIGVEPDLYADRPAEPSLSALQRITAWDDRLQQDSQLKAAIEVAKLQSETRS